MKRIIKITTIICALFFAINSNYAAINPIINIDETKTLVLSLNDWINEDVNVSIMDIYGEVLHSEKLRKGTFTGRKYNLKFLPIGKYELLVEGSNKTVVHAITVKYNKIATEPSKDRVIFKPSIAISKDAVELNHLALGNKVQFSVFDENGVFFTKTYVDQITINTKFDISGLPKGSYTIGVASKDQYYTEVFRK